MENSLSVHALVSVLANNRQNLIMTRMLTQWQTHWSRVDHILGSKRGS